jgi:hypothetical protein
MTIAWGILAAIGKAFMASWHLRVATLGLLGFLGFKAWLLVHDKQIEKAVRVETVEAVNAASEKLVEKGREGRAAASAPGAVDRLRREFCNDCR